MQRKSNNPKILGTILHEAHELVRILEIAPKLPRGYDAWIYRGVNYAAPCAIMNTSIDVTEDPLEWDNVELFQTTGHDNTHYLEAVKFHHTICKCPSCKGVTHQVRGTGRHFPDAVYTAADTLHKYFAKEGITGWEFGDVADRKLIADLKTRIESLEQDLKNSVPI